MKRLFKLTFLPVLFMAALASCSDDDNKAVANPELAPVLISPEDGTSVILTQELENNPAMTLVWNHGNYQTPTEINYTIEAAAAGSNFEAPVTVGTTSNRVYPITVNALNQVASTVGLTPFVQGAIEFRVTAALGDNSSLPMASNVITINVTPYTAIIPKLFVVGAVQGYYGLSGWSPETAMEMRYIGNEAGTTKVFECYVKVAVGDGIKFIGNQAGWGDVEGNYGVIGGVQDGNLENSGGSGDVKVADADGAGLYYIQVDLDAMTYKSVKMDWGIIGGATAGDWSNETAMSYDFDTNTYSLTTSVNAGEMKFRSANTGNFIYGDAWKFNVGNSDPNVTYNAAAGNFTVSAGSHDFTLQVGFDGVCTVGGI